MLEPKPAPVALMLFWVTVIGAAFWLSVVLAVGW